MPGRRSIGPGRQTFPVPPVGPRLLAHLVDFQGMTFYVAFALTGLKALLYSRNVKGSLQHCLSDYSCDLRMGVRNMTVVDHLRRQFAYDQWANQQVLKSIRTAAGGRGRSLQLMSHILAAERLWLERLEQRPQSLPVWPKLELQDLEREVSELARLWLRYLEEAGDPSKAVSYKNSKGELWMSTIVDVLTHVVMHSAYHRGQIASHMRASGETPAYTDFIHAVRQGFVK